MDQDIFVGSVCLALPYLPPTKQKRSPPVLFEICWCISQITMFSHKAAICLSDVSQKVNMTMFRLIYSRAGCVVNSLSCFEDAKDRSHVISVHAAVIAWLPMESLNNHHWSPKPVAVELYSRSRLSQRKLQAALVMTFTGEGKGSCVMLLEASREMGLGRKKPPVAMSCTNKARPGRRLRWHCTAFWFRTLSRDWGLATQGRATSTYLHWSATTQEMKPATNA